MIELQGGECSSLAFCSIGCLPDVKYKGLLSFYKDISDEELIESNESK